MTIVRYTTARTGLPVLAPVLAYAALTIAYVVANSSTPQPTASGLDVVRYARDNGPAITLGAILLVFSAAALIWSAAALRMRLQAVGGTLVLMGAVPAAVALAASATAAWFGSALTADTDADRARAIADLAFRTGGTAFAVTFGLFIAGISLAGRSTGRLPGAMTWTGLILAAAGLLSLLGLFISGFNYLLPLLRFGGLLWLIIAGILLARTRRANR
jgi:hypothetical protein